MKIQKIKNRTILFTNSIQGGWDLNVQLILGNTYNYIIDTGLGSDSMEPIKEYLINDPKPIIVINTHYHWDHVWGNFSVKSGLIISHKLCRDLIESTWEETLIKNEKYVQGEVKMQLPNMVFEEELYFPEDQIRIIYAPGHTIDSISVLDEKEKVLHAGDNIGDTLEELVPNLSVEKEVFVETLMKYNEMDFDTCISGHNIVLDKQVINRILNLL
ncbi:MBL fold metallo-hydrolase [Cytobacillus sp. FJAT-54145]|uniref:MBL fold metallo-hydrolase n=1 Tax=Cytobacillus spartinae TaxID=3299023 RepID=A0ABW6KB64_9BACI